MYMYMRVHIHVLQIFVDLIGWPFWPARWVVPQHSRCLEVSQPEQHGRHQRTGTRVLLYARIPSQWQSFWTTSKLQPCLKIMYTPMHRTIFKINNPLSFTMNIWCKYVCMSYIQKCLSCKIWSLLHDCICTCTVFLTIHVKDHFWLLFLNLLGYKQVQ